MTMRKSNVSLKLNAESARPKSVFDIGLRPWAALGNNERRGAAVNCLRPAICLLSMLCLPWVHGRIPVQNAAQEKDLPELNELLPHVRERLRSDRLLLSQYTYTEKQTVRKLDSQGRTTSSEERIYEVYPDPEEELTYRRLIAVNGKPTSEKDIAKSDREHEKKRMKRIENLEREGIDERARRLAKQEEEKRKEEAILDEITQLYRFALEGRVRIDGYPAVVLNFEPRPEYKPRSREAKMLAKMAGRVWICEEDYELIRVEVHLVDNISFGLGLLARLSKGATAAFQRRKINDEIWLPTEARFTGSARALLLIRRRVDTTIEYSDHMKFRVDARIQYRKDPDAKR
jgi:hypothetical protein